MNLNNNKIFICYAKEDYKMAMKIYSDLKNYGFSPWIDIENLLPGQNWKSIIEDSIYSSSHFLALLSSNSLTKTGFVQKELILAFDYLKQCPLDKIFIIPVKLDNCEPKNEILSKLHHVDLFIDYEKGFNKIVRSIELENRNNEQKIKYIEQRNIFSAGQDKWKEVYEALNSEDNNGDFHLKLNMNYHLIEQLPEKAITLYSLHISKKPKNSDKIDKIKYLIDTIIDKGDNIALFDTIVEKLNTSQWIKYADDYILDKIKNHSKISTVKADKITSKILQYLRNNYGSWDEENIASYAIEFTYNYLSYGLKIEVLSEYTRIYCDKTRSNNYQQKKFANMIFSEASKDEIWQAVKNQITLYFKDRKYSEYSDKSTTEAFKKNIAINNGIHTFDKILSIFDKSTLEKDLIKIYDQA